MINSYRNGRSRQTTRLLYQLVSRHSNLERLGCGNERRLVQMGMAQRAALLTCTKTNKKSPLIRAGFIVSSTVTKTLFYFFKDSLESFRVVHGQIGKNFTVQFDTVFLDLTHKL